MEEKTMIKLLKNLLGNLKQNETKKLEKPLDELFPFKKSILTQAQKNRQAHILEYRPYGY
jgi:flagellin-specific chaperone FliS